MSENNLKPGDSLAYADDPESVKRVVLRIDETEKGLRAIICRYVSELIWDTEGKPASFTDLRIENQDIGYVSANYVVKDNIGQWLERYMPYLAQKEEDDAKKREKISADPRDLEIAKLMAKMHELTESNTMLKVQNKGLNAIEHQQLNPYDPQQNGENLACAYVDSDNSEKYRKLKKKYRKALMAIGKLYLKALDD